MRLHIRARIVAGIESYEATEEFIAALEAELAEQTSCAHDCRVETERTHIVNADLELAAVQRQATNATMLAALEDVGNWIENLKPVLQASGNEGDFDRIISRIDNALLVKAEGGAS